MTSIPAAKGPTRNVWLHLGMPDAEEHYLKAELVLRLDKAIRHLRLTQRMAARRIGTTQPELSKILGGKFSEVSLERLMRFLTALGYRIEIKIAAAKANKPGHVRLRKCTPAGGMIVSATSSGCFVRLHRGPSRPGRVQRGPLWPSPGSALATARGELNETRDPMAPLRVAAGPSPQPPDQVGGRLSPASGRGSPPRSRRARSLTDKDPASCARKLLPHDALRRRDSGSARRVARR